MADHCGHSRSNNSRSDKEKNKQHKRRESKHGDPSRTPPVATRRSSIENLLKKREYLKEELKKIGKYSDSTIQAKNNNVKKQIKEQKHSKNEHVNRTKSRKRHSDEITIQDPKKNRETAESPELVHGDHNVLEESEDEETIIAKRRQQRKKLLEKYNAPNENFPIRKTEIDCDNLKIIDNTEISVPLSVAKETTDMFAEKDDFTPKKIPDTVTQDNTEANSRLTDNWDDEDGYYNIKTGDEICNNKFVIKSLLGKGVFANVVRAQDKLKLTEVAIKIIRNNDLMYKTGLKEMTILKMINEADPDSKYHCVKFLSNFTHKGHLCLVLESLCMDLRSVLKKYGKNRGISMKALMSYSRQLLMALRLLRKIGIIHADIKPDNILVNEKKNLLKLCDFGSATKIDDNEPTPYLVSRFYRAPEIILGMPYRHGVDLWSTACTIYEMATGKIMFTGGSNNKMLKCFMDLKGKFPVKLIRKGKFKDQHFNYNNNFLLHKKDDFTGREKMMEITNVSPTRDLLKELRKSSKNSTTNEDKKIVQLKDLLDKMLSLDSNHRLAVADCIKHQFIQEELEK